MPAKAGIQSVFKLLLDASLRWHDTHQEAVVNGTNKLFAFIFLFF
jgi:hypothetical protein